MITPKNTFVFIPDKLKFNKSGYLQGFHHQFTDCEAYYITDHIILKSCNHKEFIGYIGNEIPNNCSVHQKSLFVDFNTKKINILNSYNSRNLVEITYNLNTFKNSRVEPTGHGNQFQILLDYFKEKQKSLSINGQKPSYACMLIHLTSIILKYLENMKAILSQSATLSHFHESVKTLKWFLVQFNKERTLFSPSIGNVIISKSIDLIIGLIILQYLIEHEQFIVEMIANTTEVIIENLKELLTYLMGSPIGLKLNKAFNNCLGIFFFYHISLWRIFLNTIHPLFQKYFNILVLGAFGFSYQIALLSDMISICTFHVYCIYVYAARLIHIQLECIFSLFQLFIGRKFNPLRDRVDSYRYTQHQLFIGTLGFTVLLFLLPTTMLYYTVFTSFRLLIILCDWILYQLRLLLDILPIYIVILWVINSSDLAGTLHLRWKIANDSTKLEAILKTLPLSVAIQKFALCKNQFINHKPHNLTIKKVLTGVLI